MPKFAAQIDAMKIPILGLVPEGSSTAPANPVNGQLWYDTSAHKIKAYQNGAWVSLDANTTYSAGTDALATAGTDTTTRTWTAVSLKAAVTAHAPVKTVAGRTGAVVLTADDVAPTTARRYVPTGGTNGQFLKVNDSGALVWGADNNTTYSTSTSAEAIAGTATTGRVWTAAHVKEAVLTHAPVQSVAGKTGAVTLALNDLSNLSVASPTTGQFLKWNGTAWVNSGVAKSDIGLGNVDNTSDASKPISTATQAALDAKAPLSHNHRLDGLSDVNITSSPSDGHVLAYTSASSAWQSKALTPANIGAAPASHTHTTAQVTGLDTALSGKASTARKITAGTGLTGGGDLTADRTLAVSYGTAAGTAMEGNKRLNTIGATGDVPMSSFKITGLGTPTAATDAATKGYVDSAIQGLSVKASVRAATTANITLSATQTVDGVALAVGDRVLVKNQTDGKQNGIYIVATGAWTRSAGTDGSGDLQNGAFFFVEEGTTQADSGWVMTTDGAITPGTTAIAFVQFSGAGQVVAGNGISKSGNTLAVKLDGSSLSVGSGGVRINSGWAGQSSITTVGTITSGTWNGAAVPVANGGTGATTANIALRNLGAFGSNTVNIAEMTPGTWYTVFGVNGFVPAHVSALATDLGSIELDWRGKDVENIEVKADVALTGVQVTVTGFPI